MNRIGKCQLTFNDVFLGFGCILLHTRYFEWNRPSVRLHDNITPVLGFLNCLHEILC